SRIEKYGVNGENGQNRPSPRELIIQKNIRNFALQTLQGFVSQMSLPPSEVRYGELQEQRRADIKRRTDLERQRSAFVLKPSSSNPGLNSSGSEATQQNSKGHLKESVSFAGVDHFCGDDGWTPSTTCLRRNPFIDEADRVDPLLEQILIIKGYLQQAAEDGRLEEAKILERNLRDLELELEKQNGTVDSGK
ncbi:unnamed protein product, partial [Gongylonema pulchrum]|uniref:Rbsn domain-containing protein n=1 Tax=Gongylonema pulchrum TaxID=637853 RepID=A0A183DIJ5_9BILA